jgi:NADH-quinone oxidoreductase subunit H
MACKRKNKQGGRNMSVTMNYLLIIVLVLLFLQMLAAGLIWVERRMLAVWQDRYGPNRAGPFGLLIVLADTLKLLFKEDWIPPFADKKIFVVAPAIIVVCVLMGFVIIPFAPGILIADLNIGILFFLAMSSLAVYSIVLGGWASNNKYSLLGALRGASQMITYEVFMGLSLMGVVMLTGSFRLTDIVMAQKDLWFVVTQPIGFVIFLIAGIAETHRLPFDIPEAESELVAGYHSEYSGMKFGMFFIGEYIGITLISALVVTLFFGGWLGPAFLPPLVWFVLKTFGFILFFILLRASLPRPRYDQLMEYGWKILLPVALLNIMVTGAIVLMMNK